MVATPVVVHLSTLLDGDVPPTEPSGRASLVIEIRHPDQSGPLEHARAGDVLDLQGGGALRLTTPVAAGPSGHGVRLWAAQVALSGDTGPLSRHMRLHGRPISYSDTPDPDAVQLSDYQTVFATSEDEASATGSAEMASAGRPFSDRLVARLVSRGVGFSPIVLHAAVSSQTAGEAPQPEWFEVPAHTAELVNHTRASGGRVVAVGTTVTRALESANLRGRVAPASGWTDLVITPGSLPSPVVDALVTGWHEADASHLLLLEAVAGKELVAAAYRAAVAGPYLWHEFGDSCLFLPQSGQ